MVCGSWNGIVIGEFTNENFWFVASGEQSNYDYDSGEQPNYDEPPTCPCPHNIQLLDLQKNIQVSDAASNPKK